MTEEVSSLLLGLVAGFILALIFTGMWFVHNLKKQEELSLRALAAMKQTSDLELNHAISREYAKGLSHARLCVRYFARKMPNSKQGRGNRSLLNTVAAEIGEKMEQAELRLEIDYNELNKKVDQNQES
ncbi:TMhelix containing protein [Vibrio phage 1.179.O._10N.286.45.F12]|nr:TMhelix containing protein [Vibrio phage 1.179.O._10N.286.45.F12]